MLVSHAARVLGQANDRESNRQSLLYLVEFGLAFLRVNLVLQVQIEVVESFDAEDERALVDVELGPLHAITVPSVDSHSERLGQL